MALDPSNSSNLEQLVLKGLSILVQYALSVCHKGVSYDFVSNVVDKTSTRRRRRICYAAVQLFCIILPSSTIEDAAVAVERVHKNST